MTTENVTPMFNLASFFADRNAEVDESGMYQQVIELYDSAISSEEVIQVSEQFDPSKELDEHTLDVGIFMVKAGQPILSEPGCPTHHSRVRAAKLLLDETLETIAGLGVCITIPDGSSYLDKDCKLHYEANLPFDLVEVMDGVADVKVVSTCVALSCGFLPCATVQREVNINNLTKFRTDKDGYRREDGKWVKPSDHPTPRLKLAYDSVLKGLAAFSSFLQEQKAKRERITELTALMEEKKSQGLDITEELKEVFKLQGLELPDNEALVGMMCKVGTESVEAPELLSNVRTAECRPEDLPTNVTSDIAPDYNN